MNSDNVKKGPERAPNRSLFYALGYTPEELDRPLIGVVSAYSEIVPGHMNLDKLAQAGGLSAGLVEPVLKVTGIAIVTRLAADFCRDAKEGALSSAVETAGTALALAAVLPLMNAVLDMLAQLL